jgi:oxalate decarboxylase/phosphoglucose isomerase-like protein (cupin superfamily)
LICGDKVKHMGYDRVKLYNILPALLNKSLSYPEEVYDIYRKVFVEDDANVAASDISYDLIFLPAGLLGVEFVKTHIYYTPQAISGILSCIVEVQHGILTIIMQKNREKLDMFDIETHVNEGYVVKVHKGEKFSIPQGYFYTFINTEESPLVFVRVYRKECIVDYSLLKRERGLAYYCIRKNARQEIVLNPTYKNTPKIQEIGLDELNKQVYTSPLYQALRDETNSMCDSLYA